MEDLLPYIISGVARVVSTPSSRACRDGITDFKKK
jgi:hypothetical protein